MYLFNLQEKVCYSSKLFFNNYHSLNYLQEMVCYSSKLFFPIIIVVSIAYKKWYVTPASYFFNNYHSFNYFHDLIVLWCSDE